jgi:hypothetical protein
MARTTIFIRGISMFYHKGDGLWKVLFPFDKCHTVKFITPNNVAGDSLGVGAGARVRIKAVNPTSKFDINPNFDHFLDITSEKAHKNGVKLKADAKPFVLLTIESAKVSVGRDTHCKYQLFDGTTGLSSFNEIAYSGKAIIESEGIEIEINGEVVDGLNQDAVLVFNNICDTEDPNNPVSDLILLYDVIEDASGSGKKFTIDRDPTQKPGAAAVTPSILDAIGPKDNDPSPFFRGLPCNVVKASKSNNLE